MPAWWNRKSSKNKQEHDDDDDDEEDSRGGGIQFNFIRNGDKTKSKNKKSNKKKNTSFDELFYRNSPRSSRDFDGAASSDKKGLPLPLPTHADQNFGSPSVSGSSISSSASYDDHPISPQFNGNRFDLDFSYFNSSHRFS
jgi:hypothetical protein